MFQELKAAARRLRANPRVVLPSLLTLALGLGLNTIIFSGVNALLFDAVPFADPARLYLLSSTNARTREEVPVSYPDFRDWARESRTFDSVAAFARGRSVLERPDGTELVEQASVSAGLLPLLGVAPRIGRGFLPAEEREGQDRVVVLGHRFWRSRFGGDRGILGRSVVIDGLPMTVVGVMPEGFEFPPRTSVWKPLPASEDRQDRSLTVVGRLRPGQTPEAAAQDLQRIAGTLAREYPEADRELGATATPLAEALYGKYRAALILLQGAVLFVLLIACSNVAGLLLASGVARRSELLVRAALGASRGRLVGQLLSESLLLALVGGAVGLVVARLAVGPLAAVLPERIARADQIAVDGDVLLFSFLLSLLTGVLFGALPALQAARINLTEGLSSAYGSGIRHGRRGGGRSPQAWLLVFTTALAVLLLAGATTLIRSFLSLQKVSPGFVAAGVKTLSVQLPSHRFSAEEVAPFYDKAFSRLRSLPGVEAAGAIRTLPLTGWNPMASLEIEGEAGAAPDSAARVDIQPVSAGYFEAMRIPILAGRSLRETDAARPAVSAVINDILRRRHFPGANPIGRRIRLRNDRGFDSSWLTIVGVVGDVPQFGLHTDPRPEVYYPSWQPSMTLVVRAAGASPDRIAGLQREVQAAGAIAVVGQPRSLAEILADSLFTRRMLAVLMSVLAGVALALSTVGIYGVVSYSVARRTREIGIRMALGADRRQVIRVFVGQVARLVVTGLVLGFLGALALGRGLAGLLFRVSPLEPASILPVLTILGACALLAAYIPVRAATRVDPVSTLRVQ